MQLVAYGAQDIYLTGNPMITYFKVVYRRHTNFAVESIEQTFNGVANFGTTVNTIIARNGDLVSAIYLQAKLPDLQRAAVGADPDTGILRWTDDIGHHLIKRVDIEIGGQLIDRQFGDWLEIWAQLTLPAGKEEGYREMIGQDPRNAMGMNTGLQADLDNAGTTTAIPGRYIYVPMQFWFCRNVGLALPLIALQYHEVRVTLEFRTFNELIVAVDTKSVIGTNQGNVSLDAGHPSTASLSNVGLWVDYIFLDTEERRRFAQVSHEYLIEQVQYNGEETSIAGADATITLQFNHPVKELVWVCQFKDATSTLMRQWSNYTTISPVLCATDDTIYASPLNTFGGITTTQETTNISSATNIRVFSNQSMTRPPGAKNITKTARLMLNGHDRFSTRKGEYFNWVQPKQRHTNMPRSPGINVYSFALHPEEHQPSGTCNFSRLDLAKLVLTFNAGQNALGREDSSVAVPFSTSDLSIRIYAFNYNILRIMSGMGGLAYSA